MSNSAELLRRIDGSRLYDYEPQEQSKPFHASQAMIRLVTGGNGAGKSETTCAELAALMCGPPYPDWFKWENPPQPPFAVWAVTQKFPKTEKLHAITQKMFLGESGTDKDGNPIWNKPFISRHLVAKELSRRDLTVELTNGCIFEMKSADQDISAFESVRVQAVLVDEPIDNAIYQGLRTRLIRVPGARMWLGLTPYETTSEYLYEMMRDESGACQCFRLRTTANPYMPKEQLATLMAGMSEEVKRVRIEGELSLFQGHVYPYVMRWPDKWKEHLPPDYVWSDLNDGNFKSWQDVPTGAIPDDWTRYVIHDPGIANPAAAVWFAVDPNGNIWAYKYFYDDARSANIRDKADAMLAINGFDRIEKWIVDPFATSIRTPSIDSGRDGETLLDLYRQCGIRFTRGPRSEQQASRAKRIEAAKLYLEPSNAKPMMWFLPNDGDRYLKREFELYVYDQPKGEKNASIMPRRKHDHMMYCVETAAALKLRYLDPPERHHERAWRAATTDEIAAAAARAHWYNLERNSNRPRGQVDVG